MTHYNIFRTLVSSSIILAAIGCGDANVDEGSAFEGPAAIVPSENIGDTLLAEELELACDSICETRRECGGMDATGECVESCVAAYGVGVELGDECTRAQIDRLNCVSALDCRRSLLDEPECADALRAVRTHCEPEVLLIGEIAEMPDPVVIVDFPWGGVSDDD